VPAKKLVVSTYLQYVLIGTGALLLFAFVRQLGVVLLTFLLAGVLACVLNPLVRWLEGRGIPRVLAVLGVFAALVVVVLVALVVLIVPAAGQVGALVRNPQALIDGAAAMVDRIRELLPYVGERVAALDQQALYEFARSNAPSAGQVYNGALGFIGAVFAVPIVAIIAAVFRYLRGTLLFERWHKAPVFALDAGETAERPTSEEDPTGKVPAVTDGGKFLLGTGGNEP
jgi:putative permease